MIYLSKPKRKNTEIISISSNTLKIACHPAGKPPQDAKARSILTKSSRDSTGDVAEAASEGGHTGSERIISAVVTQWYGHVDPRKFNAAEIAKHSLDRERRSFPSFSFFFLLQHVHVMSKSKYPRLRNESGSTMLPRIIYDLLFRPLP